MLMIVEQKDELKKWEGGLGIKKRGALTNGG